MSNFDNTKIIYIAHEHLSLKNRLDYYIDYLINKKWTVEYWDLLPLLHGEIDEFGSQDADFLHTPLTYNEIETMLSLPENKDAIYIILINYGPNYLRLYRLLTKYDCKIHFFAWGAFPSSSRESKWMKIVHHFPTPLTLINKSFNTINCFVHKKLKLVKPFDVVYGAGSVILKAFSDASKLVSVNIVDYDHYVKIKTQTQSYVVGSYAVFLDSYVTHHPDLEILSLPKLNPDKYFKSLNHFFELLENKYEIKIVIAAHPKANYINNPFEGREIYSGLTPELVAKADFIVSQHSTSVSYAVLNLKPIIFVYTSIMEKIYKKARNQIVEGIILRANYLKSSVYDIDEITQEEQIVIEDVNLDCYENYKYSFLTSRESEHTTLQELFWREINDQ
jgi:hypothetical protein